MNWWKLAAAEAVSWPEMEVKWRRTEHFILTSSEDSLKSLLGHLTVCSARELFALGVLQFQKVCLSSAW